MNRTQIMIALIDPAVRPALTVAGAFFLIINLLAGAYIIRHWRRLFGRDPGVEGDREASRNLQIVVITIPWLIVTGRLAVELVGLWIN
jgi:heme/copper-type cytochrome/quinol oxidase subunit 2